MTQSDPSFDFDDPRSGLRAVRPRAAESLAPAASPIRAAEPTLSGAELVVRELERRGIEVVAGIPGGAALPLYDALQASRIRHVLARHEQGAAFIAQGMARASGKVAVCLATSGPGATNLITALADARADSIPIVAITAQVPQKLIGTDAFQEVDTCALARPVTKACFFARSVAELAELLPKAFRLAEHGRPGPVLLDIPKCVLLERLSASPERTQAEPPLAPPRPGAPRVAAWLDAAEPATWREIAEHLARSQRPLLYIGGGVHMAAAHAPLLELSRRCDIPVVSSLHGLGAYPSHDPRFLGMLGMHGAPFTNHATEEADLVLAVGARFDDRATGKPELFCRNAQIIHIDIDPRELGKIKAIAIGVVCDARRALARLCEASAPSERPLWRARIAALRAEHPLVLRGEACALLGRLSRVLDKDTVVTTDVGQHQMWVAQCLSFDQPRTLLTSGGLGTMGFGLPAAIGAALARPSRKVVCVSGDGSFMMNLQELATLAELAGVRGAPAKGVEVLTLVLNNAQLGLVRQQQQLFYSQRYSAAHFPRGSDFAAIARAFGLRGESADAAELSEQRLRELIDAPGSAVVDVRVPGNENVLPMVPPGGANLDMVLASMVD